MFIRTLLFDLGNVILPLNEEKMCAAFKALGAKNVAAKFNTPQGKELWRRYDCDMPTAEFRKAIIELLDLPANINHLKIDEAWNALLDPIPEDTFKTLELFRKLGCEILLFSNSNEIHHTRIQALYGKRFAAIFHEQHYSHHFKKAKPDHDAFSHVLQKRLLHTVLFIDDKKLNTDSAKALGMHVIEFTIGKKFASLLIDLTYQFAPPRTPYFPFYEENNPAKETDDVKALDPIRLTSKL